MRRTWSGAPFAARVGRANAPEKPIVPSTMDAYSQTELEPKLGEERGLVDFKVASIDNTWSGLRFARGRLTAGRQAGSNALWGPRMTAYSSPLSPLTTTIQYRFVYALRSHRVNATRLPSGDHAGPLSASYEEVRRRWPVPSAFATKISVPHSSVRRTNASFVPSGEKSESKALLTISFRSVPSGRIVEIPCSEEKASRVPSGDQSGAAASLTRS